MGLDANTIRFILYAKSLGVNFAKTAMIGRQRLFLSPKELRKNLNNFGYQTSIEQAECLIQKGKKYLEPLLEMLGAREISSIDISDWENATDIHDLNMPIGEDLKERFTVVLEAGTIEHIFNFPQCIRNCMNMIGVQGHFICITPGNNFLGHGFYQFSPDLFFRIFNEKNGFELIKMILIERSPTARWYEAIDPKGIEQWWRDETHVYSSNPAYLATLVKKIKSVPIFTSIPQQSKYMTFWAYFEQNQNNTASISSGQKPSMTGAQKLKRYILTLTHFLCFMLLRSFLSCAKLFFRIFGYDIIRHRYHRKLFKKMRMDFK